MSDTLVSDAELLVLDQELRIIEQELATATQQLEDLRRVYADAIDAEGAAMDAAREAHDAAYPLVKATLADNQAGYMVDLGWRLDNPAAAQAHAQATAADQAARAAGVRTTRLAKAIEDAEWRLLPRLRGALSDQQAAIARHHQQHAQAVERARTFGLHLEAFRKKIRGES